MSDSRAIFIEPANGDLKSGLSFLARTLSCWQHRVRGGMGEMRPGMETGTRDSTAERARPRNMGLLSFGSWGGLWSWRVTRSGFCFTKVTLARAKKMKGHEGVREINQAGVRSQAR